VNQVYLNGRFVAPDEAYVSAFDRGFIFGDGIYEVLPVYGRRPFRLEQHLARMDTNLAAIGLPNPMARTGWAQAIDGLIASNPGRDQSLYIQVTRGPAPRDHAYPSTTTPTVFAYSQELKPVAAELLEKGVSAVTAEDIRWQRCDIKTIALLANVMFRQFAAERGATEAILVRDGRITEGAASNIFIVRDGVMQTAPKGSHILPGITRDLIIELAIRRGLPYREESFSEAEMFAADEVWMTSSTKEILPITRINDAPVGDGRPGPVFVRTYAIYQEYKDAFREGGVEPA
jgi:D-alanine transaminase